MHPATRPAAQGQPLGTPGLPGVLPPPLPALGRGERCRRALGPQSQPWSIPMSPRARPCPLGPAPAWRGARAKALVTVPPPYLLLQSPAQRCWRRRKGTRLLPRCPCLGDSPRETPVALPCRGRGAGCLPAKHPRGPKAGSSLRRLINAG